MQSPEGLEQGLGYRSAGADFDQENCDLRDCILVSVGVQTRSGRMLLGGPLAGRPQVPDNL